MLAVNGLEKENYDDDKKFVKSRMKEFSRAKLSMNGLGQDCHNMSVQHRFLGCSTWLCFTVTVDKMQWNAVPFCLYNWVSEIVRLRGLASATAKTPATEGAAPAHRYLARG